MDDLNPNSTTIPLEPSLESMDSISGGSETEQSHQIINYHCSRCASNFQKESVAIVVNCPNCGSQGEAIRETSSVVHAETSPTAAARCSLPFTIGPYFATRLIGEGGFGSVYQATHTRTKREVALKVIRQRKDDSTTRLQQRIAAFCQEGQKSIALRHPGIVETFEVESGDAQQPPYIAMELVAGGSLAELLQSERKLNPLRVARLMRDVADAVHAAHSRNIFHRDLKPSNILLTEDGQVKVADFGLALHEDEQLHHEGEVTGTWPYMSPEQIRGKAQYLDGRSDIWSLGIILYELLAGRRPFEGDKRQLKDAILEKPYRPLSQRDLKIPMAFDDIIAGCLAKSPENRFASAAALRDALNRMLRRDCLNKAAIGGCLSLGIIAAAFPFWLPRKERPIEEEVGTQQWLHVPLRKPKEIYGLSADTSAHLDFVATDRQLQVVSKGLSVVDCGLTKSQNWRMAVKLMNVGNQSWSGVFFGLRDFQDTTHRGQRFQFVVIMAQGPKEARIRLLRRGIYDLREIPGASLGEQIGSCLDIPLPAKLQDKSEIALQVDFVGGFCSRIQCDDCPFPELVAPRIKGQSLDVSWPPAAGRFGIVNAMGTTVVREHLVNVTRRITR